jgi:hypothetical protein
MVAYRLSNEALNAFIIELNTSDFEKYRAITQPNESVPSAVGEA